MFLFLYSLLTRFFGCDKLTLGDGERCFNRFCSLTLFNTNDKFILYT